MGCDGYLLMLLTAFSRSKVTHHEFIKSQKQRLSSRAVWLRKRNRDIQIDRRNHHLRGSNEKAKKKRKGMVWRNYREKKKDQSKNQQKKYSQES
jgi:hypothetical protein